MRRMLVFAALAASLAACGSAPETPTVAPLQLATSTPSATPAPAPESDVAKPVRIRIPAIKVDAKLVPLGDEKPGVMEVPNPGLAGWYAKKPAVRPGQTGPGVIAAHYDNKNGADVFYQLNKLTKGDEITVVDAKGRTHEFVVQRKVQTAKTALPAEDIFSATMGPTLRLITCGGPFNKDVGHYADNVTIFADAAA